MPKSWSNKRDERNGRSQSSHQSRKLNGTTDISTEITKLFKRPQYKQLFIKCTISYFIFFVKQTKKLSPIHSIEFFLSLTKRKNMYNNLHQKNNSNFKTTYCLRFFLRVLALNENQILLDFSFSPPIYISLWIFKFSRRILKTEWLFHRSPDTVWAITALCVINLFSACWCSFARSRQRPIHFFELVIHFAFFFGWRFLFASHHYLWSFWKQNTHTQNRWNISRNCYMMLMMKV